MAYTPQTGTGATLTLVATGLVVRDMSFNFEAEAIECTSLADYYKYFTGGRRTGTISGTMLLGSETTSNALHTAIDAMQSATARNTAVAFVYTDAGGGNIYSGSCIVTKIGQVTKADDVETCSIEMQVTGSIS